MTAIIKGVFVKNKEFKNDSGETIKSAVILSDEDKLTIYNKHFTGVQQFQPVQCECVVRINQKGTGFSISAV